MVCDGGVGARCLSTWQSALLCTGTQVRAVQLQIQSPHCTSSHLSLACVCTILLNLGANRHASYTWPLWART